MSLGLRRVGSLSVLVSCAALVAWGCSSDDSKKVAVFPGDAGAGGEGGALIPEGGAAGALSAPSEAGQGGAPETAGATGADGGAGGAAPLACAPSGTASSLTIQSDPEVTLKVCRGALAHVAYSATNTDETFTCCGVSDTADPYTVKAMGIFNGEAGGTLSFLIPAAAPLGAQSVTLTCAPGPVENTANVQVTDTAPPVVTSATVALNRHTLTVTGSKLAGVTSITAVLVGDPFNRNNCIIDSESVSDTSLACGFDGQLNSGTYTVLVEQDDCGYAAHQPTFTILPIP